jgi:hypothetical protein
MTAEFASWRSFEDFAHEVQRKSRYLRTETSERFLETVLAISQPRRKTLRAGAILWRAQKGHAWISEAQDGLSYEIPGPLEPKRMIPLEHQAREGRVNPKGIPCLYLATDKETAMAETRPWIGLSVSVGQFKTKNDLLLVDCSALHGKKMVYLFAEPSPEKRDNSVWASIDDAFSRPVNPDDSTAGYAATQVLAEVFRADGCDGILYKSLLGDGHNVALFNVAAADLLNCFLYEPKAIKFEFGETANPYFIKAREGRKS